MKVILILSQLFKTFLGKENLRNQLKGTQYTDMLSECKYLVRTQLVELAKLQSKKQTNFLPISFTF